MAFNIVVYQDNEEKLFYSAGDNEPIEKACVGHLRGDFGRDGNEFWTTWWEHQSELKTPDFAAELKTVIDELRNIGVLNSFRGMLNYCYQHPAAQIKSKGYDGDEVYGFKVDGKAHDFFLRLIPHRGDYNIYCYCYRRDLLEQALSLQHKQEPRQYLLDAIKEHDFEEIELFGKPALFTNGRIDRGTIPKGFFAYDVRESEGFSGIPCQIGKRVVVNHMGTVLTNEMIRGMHNGFRSITDEDINFGAGDCSSLHEYREKYPPMKVREKEQER